MDNDIAPKYFGPFLWIDSEYEGIAYEGNYDETITEFMDEMTWNQYWDIESLAEHLKSHEHLEVLDVGCGDGRIIHHLLEAGVFNSYSGIDISNSAYRSYLEKSEKYKFSFNFYQGDFFNFNFEKKFDVVYIGSVSINSFVDIESVGKFLSVAKRALKSGGRVVVSAYPLESERSLRALDGTISAEPYVNKDGHYQLMWRGMRYSPPYLLQNSFCERGYSGKPTLCSGLERIWVDRDIIDFAEALGWSLGHVSSSCVGDGGAEGYKVTTFSLSID